jgi:hypothetical protein
MISVAKSTWTNMYLLNSKNQNQMTESKEHKEIFEILYQSNLIEEIRDDEKDIIIKLWKDGKTFKQIAVEYDRSYECIRSKYFKGVRKMIIKLRQTIERWDEVKSLKEKFDRVSKLYSESLKLIPKQDEPEKIVKTNTIKIVDLPFTTRVINCLLCAKIETIGDLKTYNRTELIRFRNMGVKSIAHINAVLKQYDIQL